MVTKSFYFWAVELFVGFCGCLSVASCFNHTPPCTEAILLVVAVCAVVAADTASNVALTVPASSAVKLSTLTTLLLLTPRAGLARPTGNQPPGIFPRLDDPSSEGLACVPSLGVSAVKEFCLLAEAFEGHRVAAPTARRLFTLAATIAAPESLDFDGRVSFLDGFLVALLHPLAFCLPTGRTGPLGADGEPLIAEAEMEGPSRRTFYRSCEGHRAIAPAARKSSSLAAAVATP